MRRFYAFIVMIVSMLAVVFFNVQGQYYQFNNGLEYSRGTQITYSITPNDDQTEISMNEVSDLFIERLEAAGAKDYFVDTLEDSANEEYQVQVRLPGVEANLTNILRSLEADSQIRITTTNDEVIEGDYEMIPNSASVDFDGSTGIVKIEITEEFADLCKKLDEGSSDGETTVLGDLIIIWTEYDETVDSYEEAKKGETVAQKDMQKRILAVLDKSSFHEKDGDTPAYLTFSAIGFASDSVSSTTLYANSANSVERLLNSTPLDYKITKLYTQNLGAQLGNNAIIFTSVAIIIALVAIAAFLFVKYGLNGIAGFTTLVVSLFLTVVVYNFFSLPITPVFLLSLLASTAMGLTIIITYFERFKNELYKGRSAAKANKDAYKLTVSTAIDASVFTLVASTILAFVARNAMQNFFIFSIISSITNFLLCLLVTRVLLYFLTNSKVAENKKLFRVNTDLIPNLNNEESQVFFGKHEKFNVKKHAKKSFLTLIILGAVSVLSLSAFSIFGNTFNHTNEFDNYTIVQIVDTNGKENFSKEEDVEKFFDQFEMDPYEININIVVDPKDEDGKKEVYYIEAKFNTYIGEDDSKRDDVRLALENMDFEFIDSEEETYDDLNFLLCSPQVLTPNFNNAILLILLTAVFAIVYSIIRYRYTFTLATITTVASNVLVTTGLISLFRLPVSSNLGIGLVAGVFVVSLLEFILLIKYSQLVKDNKTKVTTYEQRKDIIEVALRRSITPITVVYLAVIIALALFAIFTSKSLITTYLVMALTVSIGLLLLLFIFVPIYLFAERKLRIRRIVRKNKNKKVSKRKQERLRQKEIRNKRLASEPEEVIIPGIND